VQCEESYGEVLLEEELLSGEVKLLEDKAIRELAVTLGVRGSTEAY